MSGNLQLSHAKGTYLVFVFGILCFVLCCVLRVVAVLLVVLLRFTLCCRVVVLLRCCAVALLCCCVVVLSVQDITQECYVRLVLNFVSELKFSPMDLKRFVNVEVLTRQTLEPSLIANVTLPRLTINIIDKGMSFFLR